MAIPEPGPAAGSGLAGTAAVSGAAGLAGAAGVADAGFAGHDASVPSSAGGGGGAGGVTTPLTRSVLYASGDGPSITLFDLDVPGAQLTKRATFPAGKSPSYLAVSPDKRFLYAIDEADPPDSVVIAFAIDPQTGALREIDRAETGGAGAPHLAVHPSGRWIAVAHYTSGDVSILPVRSDGGVAAASVVTRGPDGNSLNAHQVVFSRDGRYLFVPCLGSNYVLQFVFDAGSLRPNDPASVPVAGGPRHMALDPTEQHAYVLSELASTITSFAYDAVSGKLSQPQTIGSFQKKAGASAHILVHPSARFLYASNRDENSIGLFSLDLDARPHPIAFQTELIQEPRDFTIDPSGSLLISANQSGTEDLLIYRIDPASGALSRMRSVPVGGDPSFVGVLALP